MQELSIYNLHVSVEGTEILKGISLTLKPGEIHAIMGPNGSGKSTLAYALAGHPGYEITEGTVSLNGKEITEASADERAKAGLFLAFQYPSEVSGVRLFNFLYLAYKAVSGKEISAVEFLRSLDDKLQLLSMEKSFLERSVNEGFSGGEKKKAEILQLLALSPHYAILDETDSGLDVDALKTVALGAKTLSDRSTDPSGILVITHYQRILDYITPHYVHVLMHGQIVQSGDASLAKKLEKEGYAWLAEGAHE